MIYTHPESFYPTKCSSQLNELLNEARLPRSLFLVTLTVAWGLHHPQQPLTGFPSWATGLLLGDHASKGGGAEWKWHHNTLKGLEGSQLPKLSCVGGESSSVVGDTLVGKVPDL